MVAAAVAGSIFLASCGGSAPRGPATISRTPAAQPWGLVGIAGDEPRAVLAARETLIRPGTAADAAVIMFFAMTVTLPSAVGLAGGGSCLVFDPQTARTEAFDFAPRPSAAGPAVVPVADRALFAMQAKYGKMRWEALLAPAENLARFGHPISRALAADLAASGASLANDPVARALFTRPNGSMLGEGDQLVQPELAATLSSLRARGPGEMHSGALARRIAEGSAQAGVVITVADLERAVPLARPAIVVRFDSLNLYFSPPPSTGGVAAAQLWSMLAPRWRSAAADERPHLFAEASTRQYVDRARWIDADLNNVAAVAALASDQRARELMAGYQAGRRTAPAVAALAANTDEAGASFVVADQQGMTVACATSLGPRFGSGRLIAGTGMFQVAASGESGRGFQSGAAMFAVGDLGSGILSLTDRSGQLVFAGAAGGGEPAGAALAGVALRAIVDTRPIGEAVDAPRVQHGAGEGIDVEANDEGRLPGLGARGYSARPVPLLGRVNALICPDGANSDPSACRLSIDRRGFGLATGGK
jgi:gamma-glutamyltranspeptidase/glutathione hydrolase